jgi:hypothetical protein
MQRPVLQFEKMLIGWLAVWVPQYWIVGLGWPIIQFVLVATGAAVEQVFKIIAATFGSRLIMVNRKFTARVCFRDTAILTSEVGALPYLLSNIVGDCHAGCASSR